MAIEFEDKSNKVIINPKDITKVIVQEQVNKVDVSFGGPQGIPGPTGPMGPTGPSGKYTISETAPTENLEDGDLWFKSNTAQLYFYYDSYWVETSTSYLGPTGPTGAGVPVGGTAGQYLTKIDSTNYNTQWTSPPSASRWSPTFQATGLTFTGTNSTYPTYNSYYIKFGQLVSFNIAIDLTTVTNFGTGQFKVDLPFAPIASAANHFSAWAWVNPALPADDLNGHIQMVADHLSSSQTLDFHWILSITSSPKPVIESLFSQGSPVTLTTASKIYVNGTYISAS